MDSLKAYLRQKIQDILNEDFRFNYDDKLYYPNFKMKSTCEYAIKAVTKNKLTGKGEAEGTGLRKAYSIIAGEGMTHAQLKRMKSFFDRNFQQYKQEKSNNKNINNSGIIQKWNLWGGDAGYYWVSNHLKSTKQHNQHSKNNRPKGHKNMMDPTNTRVRTALSYSRNSLKENILPFQEEIKQNLQTLFKGTVYDKTNTVQQRIDQLFTTHKNWIDMASRIYNAQEIAEKLFKYSQNLPK